MLYKKIILFDTSIASLNKGDSIIMRSILKELEPIISNNDVIHFPTHTVCFPFYENDLSRANHVKNADLKFVCGTDLLQSNMLKRTPLWKVNIFNSRPLNNLILVGVGSDGENCKINSYTRFLYNKILSHEYYHSVRDEITKRKLESLGFKAINTGCPTLWRLTEEHCRKIPKEKAESVVFTLTSSKKKSNFR